jgi:CubicO group peptidase (beta-lactamase class C family)
MNLEPVDSLITEAINDGAFPGAAFAVHHKGRVRKRFFGRQTYCPESREIDESTLWDLASLTKVVATTSVAMILHDRGKLDIDRKLTEVIPEFLGDGKDKITFRDLLVHDAGLKPDIPYIERYFDQDSILEAIFAEPLEYETGTKMVYSDLSMILMAQAMQRITGETLDTFAQKHVFGPLEMRQTRFSPAALDRRTGESMPDLCDRCAPTETLDPWRKKLRDRRFTSPEQIRLFGGSPAYIQAEVHDPTAAVLEGVAGHAGLFSTLDDLVRFVAGLTAGKVAKRATVAAWTKCQSSLSSRGLGWDTKSDPSSAGTLFGDRSFGHTGYTGTSIWCDPENHVYAVLLTNRVHPTSDNDKIRAVRPAFHDAIFQAAVG